MVTKKIAKAPADKPEVKPAKAPAVKKAKAPAKPKVAKVAKAAELEPAPATLAEWEDSLVSMFPEEHHKIALREQFEKLHSIVKEG